MRYLQTTESMNTALLALLLQLSVSSSRPPADSSRDKMRTVPGEVRQCANNEDCRQFVTAEDDLQGESFSILTPPVKLLFLHQLYFWLQKQPNKL